MVVNLTAVTPAAGGFLTAYAAGTTRPGVSTVNYTAGRTVANQAILPLGSSGGVSVYSSASTDLLLDVTGYFTAGSAYHAAAPARVLDSRNRAMPAAGSTTTVTVSGVPSTGVESVVVNVTVVGPRTGGYLTVYPAGQTRPTTSTTNYTTGVTIAGLATVKGNRLAIYTSTATHLLVDVQGWYSTGGDYTAIAPQRLRDTRGSTPVPAGGQLDVAALGVRGLPEEGISAIEITVTAVKPTASAYLTAFPTGEAAPTASSLNANRDVTIANSATVKVGLKGQVTVRTSATTHVLVDVVGYFVGPTPSPQWRDHQTVTPTSSPLNAVSCVDASFCMGVDNNGSAHRFDGTRWTAPQVADPGVPLAAVSCASRSFCVALPRFGQPAEVLTYNGLAWTRRSMATPLDFVSCPTATHCEASSAAGIVTYDGVSWSAPKPLQPSYPGGPSTARSISCPSVDFCAALGPYGTLFVEQNGTWSAPMEGKPTRQVDFDDLSCASPTLCVAVTNSSIGTFDGTSWTYTSTDWWNLYQVSCSLDGLCVGVDYAGRARILRGGSWSAASTGLTPNAAQTVSCGSGSTCMVVANDGSTGLYSNGAFTSAGTIPYALPDLTGVSCPSDGDCLASSGSAGPLYTLHNGTWTKGGLGPVNTAVGSCVSSDYCISVDRIGHAYRYTGQWVELPTPPASFMSISCSSRTFCMAAGQGTVARFDGTTWRDVTSPGVGSVSCANTQFCVAVGGQSAIVWNGTSWSSPKTLTTNGTHQLATVSCPRVGFCMVGDDSGAAYSYTSGSWTTYLVEYGVPAVQSMSCTSSTFCRAIVSGSIYAFDGTTWAHDLTDLPNMPMSLSCSSRWFCVAVDSEGRYLTWS